jgi:hypothetical protein
MEITLEVLTSRFVGQRVKISDHHKPGERAHHPFLGPDSEGVCTSINFTGSGMNFILDEGRCVYGFGPDGLGETSVEGELSGRNTWFRRRVEIIPA